MQYFKANILFDHHSLLSNQTWVSYLSSHYDCGFAYYRPHQKKYMEARTAASQGMPASQLDMNMMAATPLQLPQTTNTIHQLPKPGGFTFCDVFVV